jgi:hypothetical protein
MSVETEPGSLCERNDHVKVRGVKLVVETKSMSVGVVEEDSKLG